MGSYGKVLRGTGRYLKLAFKPLLYVIIPITLLIVWLDRSLGLTAIQTNTPFLLTARVNNPQALDSVSIDLPPEITASAPPVHVAADNEVVWRLVASREGAYDVKISADGQSAEKTVRVSVGVGASFARTFARPFLAENVLVGRIRRCRTNSAVESITVDYPERNISLGIAGYEMNWIWLFFILSMIAGFIFKELLGIQV